MSLLALLPLVLGPVQVVAPVLVLAPVLAGPASAGPERGGESVATAAPTAGADELAVALAVVRRDLILRLDELVDEAQGRKLYLQRDHVYAALIELEPDHKVARRALAYRRDRDRNWERGRYREPSDRGKQGALEEFEALRESRLGAIFRRQLELLSQPGVSPARRERELRSWVAVDPQNEELRAALGERRGPQGDWLLTDSVKALARRKELRRHVFDARDSVPRPEPWSVPASLGHKALPWTVSLRTRAARIAGTVEESEIRADLDALYVLSKLLDVAVKPAPIPAGEPRRIASGWRKRFTVYVLGSRRQIPALLAGFPELKPEDRDIFPQLITGWLRGGYVLGIWGHDELARRDSLSRQVAGGWIRDSYGVSTRQGWVWEGLGLYLSEHAVGTRLTFFIRPSPYVQGNQGLNLSKRLQAKGADWYGLLADLMATDRPPQLAFLLGKDVNGMEERELLLAHGLAAWLVEARPEQAPVIFGRVGSGEDSVRVLEEVLGMRLPDLEKHLARWAGEVRETRGK